jgi:hypothetical protein
VSAFVGRAEALAKQQHTQNPTKAMTEKKIVDRRKKRKDI